MQDKSPGTVQGSQEEQRIETQLASQLQQPQRRNARQVQQQEIEERQATSTQQGPSKLLSTIRVFKLFDIASITQWLSANEKELLQRQRRAV
jgi:hypothetical protein